MKDLLMNDELYRMVYDEMLKLSSNIVLKVFKRNKESVCH